MQVTGIEVIRPEVPAIGVVAGEKVQLTYSDTLLIYVSFDYRGLAGSATLYGAIGNSGIFGFDEILHAEASVALPQSPEDFTPCMASVDIPITSEISPGTDYDLYCKIMEVPGPDIFSPEVLDVIDVVGIPPVEELVYEHEYPEALTYVGKAEECTATLTIPLPDQFFPNSWVTEKIADTFASEVAKEGGVMLDVKIYEDATPTFHTNYRIVATAHASPFPWAVVIPLVLAIILVVAFIMLTVEFKEIDWGEVPVAIPWAILALAGGVAILGAGAAYALTTRKR